jgi:DNA repair exonuclease SbcCD ATPase subunit
MLARLTVRNVKGVNGDWQLKPITILTGPNWSGKTALLEAITILMCGHVPAIGKRPIDTKTLMSGKSMRLTGNFEDPPHSCNMVFGEGSKIEVIPDDQMFAPVEMVTLAEFEKMTGAAQMRELMRRSSDPTPPAVVWSKIAKEMAAAGYTTDDIGDWSKFSESTDTSCIEWNDRLREEIDLRIKNAKSQDAAAKAVVNKVVDVQIDSKELPPQNVQTSLDAAHAASKEAQLKFTVISNELATARAKVSALVDTGARLKRDAERLAEDAKKAPKCALCGGPVECPACAKSAASREVSLKAKLAEKDQVSKDWAAARSVEKAAAAKVDAARLELQPFEEKIAVLQRQQDRWNALQGENRVIERSQQLMDELLKTRRMLEKLKTVVTSVLDSLLEDGLKGVLDVANLLIRPMLQREIVYRDQVFSLLDEDAKLISPKTFSGTERAVINLGISIALTAKHPEQIMLVDELNVMRPEIKKRFVHVMDHLIYTGVIQQLICVDHSWNDDMAEGLKSKVAVIDMTNARAK